ncbi:glycerate kinase [Actinomyces bowdenii]|uniref:Glycerate kinase n=2 Tax=Actinomyces bowdenii TaxID=131109 RepID=A0A3P1V9J0_9ACTO|nr:glycerate kinase [Actinomyces bowdenii]
MRVLMAPGQMRPEPAGVPLYAPGRGLDAPRAAGALARGWAGARPQDDVVELPMADGAPGSAHCLPARRILAREALQGHGPTGQIREIDLVHLSAAAPPGVGGGPAPAPTRARDGGRDGIGGTWYLDAARLTALPADPDQAAQEAREGTTAGLGQVVAQALERLGPADTLVVGMARSAVNDGGLGLLTSLADSLGGLGAARDLMRERSVGLALADPIALGGVAGAGAGLALLAGLGAQEAQDLDRAACAQGARVLSLARQAGGSGPPLLPVVGGAPARLSVTGWGTGAGGGAALALRALGAWARPGAPVMAGLIGLQGALADREVVLTACGEAYDVLADSLVAVVGASAAGRALPAILVAGRCAVPRGELAAAGISAAYAVEQMAGRRDDRRDAGWDDGTVEEVEARVEAMGARLARTWSR